MLGDKKAYSGFAVKDIAAAQDFYGEKLGVSTQMVSEEVGLLQLNLAEGRDTLIYAKPDHQAANYTMLNFIVEDVDAAVDELTSRGVEFEHYEGFDQDEKGIARGPGPTIAWFKDPSGNILSVHSEP